MVGGVVHIDGQLWDHGLVLGRVVLDAGYTKNLEELAVVEGCLCRCNGSGVWAYGLLPSLVREWHACCTMQLRGRVG